MRDGSKHKKDKVYFIWLKLIENFVRPKSLEWLKRGENRSETFLSKQSLPVRAKSFVLQVDTQFEIALVLNWLSPAYWFK